MARQRAQSRVNQFIGGFNTEANPLSFPENASIDEQNCELNSNGSRSRRDGFDLDGGTNIDTGVEAPSGGDFTTRQFVWENPGNNTDNRFVVAQVLNKVYVFGTDVEPISDNLLYTLTLGQTDTTVLFDFTDIDGKLFIVDGTSEITVLSYDDGTFSYETDRLLIRDFFGVYTPNLSDVSNFQVRPTYLTDLHKYNLRNQTFGPNRPRDNDSQTTQDPIERFALRHNEKYGYVRYPSNADNVNTFIFSDPQLDGRTLERFFASNIVLENPPSNYAPRGHFIIDAVNRGQSRIDAAYNLDLRRPDSPPATYLDLPDDRTEGGPTVVEKYAGRIWYAGLNGQTIGGDERSPNLESYVFFSQVVQDPKQAFYCYQEADPTSNIDADLVSTDGGYIKIDGAYGIVSMVQAGTALFVFATNGVWKIVGIDNNSFSATSYSVSKVSGRGAISPSSVVYTGADIAYWSQYSIMGLSENNIGEWEASDLTEETIKSYYQDIPSYAKENSSGYYDTATRSIRWVYKDQVSLATYSEELVLNTKFSSFTKNRIELIDGVVGPTSSCVALRYGTVDEAVTVLGEDVTVLDEVVLSPDEDYSSKVDKKYYCVVVSISPTVVFTFGDYSNEADPYDWVSLEQTDSRAYITTGPITAGDSRLTKDIPYVTTHFERTERDEVESSCYLQTQWDWTSDPYAGKWSTARQAYRPSRITSGDKIVSTRNRVRGFGRSVSLNFTSEEGKTFTLYGWEHDIDAAQQE